MKTEVVHELDGKWYFWIETWTDRIGPYDSKTECIKAVNEYADELGKEIVELVARQKKIEKAINIIEAH